MHDRSISNCDNVPTGGKMLVKRNDCVSIYTATNTKQIHKYKTLFPQVKSQWSFSYGSDSNIETYEDGFGIYCVIHKSRPWYDVRAAKHL